MALMKPAQTGDNQAVADLLAKRPTAAENARAMSELEQLLKDYEDRYDLPSDRLKAALDAGEITETLDVCDWLIHYSIYLRAEEW